MVDGWLALTLGFAVIDWTAVAAGWKRVRFITKPATLLALILWFSLVGGWRGPLLWFGLALICSWLGDVFLLLPQRWFAAGLASFLAAHVFYIIGLNQSWPHLHWWVILFLAAVVALAWHIFPRILKGLRNCEDTEKLCTPVIIYASVIAVMLFSALLNLARPGWPMAAGLPVAVGALLFFCSDSILATNRFARPLPYAEVAVMVTYHVGQLAIIAGVLIYYSGLFISR
jgi:uncharacterized membrane protein YhhN